jgi:hypothetical protein
MTARTCRAEPAPEPRKGVRLVPGERLGALARPPPREPDADRLEHRRGHLELLVLTVGQVRRQREGPAVGHQMDLGPDAARERPSAWSTRSGPPRPRRACS